MTVDSGENTVYVRVSYTEADGTDVKDELIPFSFNGVAYIEPFATATVLLNDEPFNNQLVILQEYDFSDFTLTGYTEHGDAPEPVLTSVTAHFTNGGQADLTYDATTGSFIAYDGWVYTFTFSYNTNLGAGNTYVVGNITSVNQ